MKTENESMITPLIQLEVPSEKQPDIRVKPFIFESTEVEIEAVVFPISVWTRCRVRNDEEIDAAMEGDK